MIKALYKGKGYACDKFNVRKGDIVFLDEEHFKELKKKYPKDWKLLKKINKKLPPIHTGGRPEDGVQRVWKDTQKPLSPSELKKL